MARKGASREGPKKSKQTRRIRYKRFVDCSVPVEDSIFDLDHFNKYVLEKFKVEGRAGNLKRGGVTTFKKEENLNVHSDVKYSKRYLKYLTRKYLKKQGTDEILRVISTGNKAHKRGYKLVYRKFKNADEEAEPEAEEQTTEQTNE